MEFSPKAGGRFSRETSIVVLTLDSGEVYVAASLSSRNDTQLIYIDPTTGALLHHGTSGLDLFPSESDAIDFITTGSGWLCKSSVPAKALLGYVVLGGLGLLFVATKVSAGISNLPGGGCVFTVVESQCIKVPLLNPQVQGKGELNNAQDLAEIDINGKHYFCESRDVTRPFPSRMPVDEPDEEFVWNGWLSMSFKNIGLPHHCVTLLQGFAECRSFGNSGQMEGIVAHIARRSRLHPGTRYLARGLNSCFAAGNEVECEQLVWIPKTPGQNTPFNSYIWRRGTIPIWWGAELKITATEAVIYISDCDPYKGSVQYYQRLIKRYDAGSFDVVGEGNQNKEALVPIACINLLRNGEGKAESILVQHFEESLSYVKSTGKLPSTKIHLINYDWHASTRLKGEQETIEGMWKLLKGPTVSIGVSEGDYLPSGLQTKDYCGEIIHNDDFGGDFCIRSHQNGVIRYNCADSLDRTNAASYFGSLQVLMEQCRRLGISFDDDQAMDTHSEHMAPLPPGWEKKIDTVTEKTCYMDHNTSTTIWTHPCPDNPWKKFDMTFEEFKRSTVLFPVSQLADLFLLAGDIHATLYTGSQAMHSQILNIFNEEAGMFKPFSAAQNLKITLLRRYKNAVVDSSRQKQLEMFLGMRLFKHLPSIPIQPLNVLSRASSFLLKPITNMRPSSNGGTGLLSFKKKGEISVFPEGADVVQLFIYLTEPCHVCQLLLTVSHGADDSTYPATVDVRTGRNLDGLNLILEGASIPHCENGTNLLITLSGPINAEDMANTRAGARLHSQDVSTGPLLYDFKEPEGELDFLTRIVAVTFYPVDSGKSSMTLGELEILGVSLPWRGMFYGEGHGARLAHLAEKIHKEIHHFSSGSGTNPFLASSLNEDLSKLVKTSTSADQLVDIVTGEVTLSDTISQPVSETVVHQGVGDVILGSLDQHVGFHGAEIDHKVSSPEDPEVSETVVHQGDVILASFDQHVGFHGAEIDRKFSSPEDPEVSETVVHQGDVILGSLDQPVGFHGAEIDHKVSSPEDPEVSGTVVHQGDVILGSLDQHVGFYGAEIDHKVSSPEDPEVSETVVHQGDVILGSLDQPVGFHGAEIDQEVSSPDDPEVSETIVHQGDVILGSLDQHVGFHGADIDHKVSSPEDPEVSATDVHQGDVILGSMDQHVRFHGAETDHKVSSPEDPEVTDSCSQRYINCLISLAGPHMEKKLSFQEAMKLEVERLRLNISAAERDRTLLSTGTDPATINPNLLLDEIYIGRLCRLANSLALVGHTYLEDKITAAIGLDKFNDYVDFWNITEIGEICSGGTCEVRAEIKTLVQIPSTASSVGAPHPDILCSQCRRKVCKVCCAGRGAQLLSYYSPQEVSNYSQEGSGHVSRIDLSNGLDGLVCKKCCPEILLDALILDYVRGLISARRNARADDAACGALNQVIGSSVGDWLSGKNLRFAGQRVNKVHSDFLNGEESVAEFPCASLLELVETAAHSAPALSLLAPLESGSFSSYWKAPPNATSAEFVIVLGSISDVSGVILLVSPCGYSAGDTPIVQIWASNFIHREERSYVGKWDVQSLISSSSDFCGPEKEFSNDTAPRHVRFTFENPVRCRIIWMTLRLQRPGSSSLNYEKSCNHLSLDENLSAAVNPQVNLRASFGGSSEAIPCLHAKRIIVVGIPVRKETGLESSAGSESDQMTNRSLLERAPQLRRFKVPIVAERVMDNDLVVEQHLYPASQKIAGFRLEAFSAIKPRVTHSPFSDAQIWDASITFLRDTHIYPAVLYLQVSVVQEEPNSEVVTIAEYRLPEAKAGTGFYFDLPKLVQTRRIVFKLMGNIAAFSDDPAEQDTSGVKVFAAGLSLSNRIKLYYYADPYEVGKWASLSAI